MSNLLFEIDGQELNIETKEELNESSGQKEKTYKIKGIFSTIGERNRNGRVYPRNLWEAEVKAYQNEINGGTINTLMEYEHPPRTEVDPMKAVAKITKLGIKGNYVMGEAVLLNNAQSNQLKSLIDNGVKISVSSRGVGTVNDGVVENFKLITYDIVPNPSDFNATMNGMCESYQLNEGMLVGKEFIEDKFGNIVEANVSKDEMKNAIKSVFKDYINTLKGDI
jgi:hypothetical protein